jgi:hypothetical protein
MRRVPSLSVLAVACLLGIAANARAETRDDMCTQPKMATEKWKARSEVAGMTILIPPGFTAGGHSAYQETADTHFYISGEHRSLAVGSGRGPAFVTQVSGVSESGECEASIAGRHVTITMYRWTVEDAMLSASGDAGSHFAAVARFYATGTSREVYVSLSSNAPSDLKYYRGIFWTVSFGDAPAATTAATTAASPAGASPAVVSTVAAVASAAAAPAAGSPCAALASSVIDSTLVQSLLTGAAPIPKGFEVMNLQFDASGALAGIAVSQTDLPEASQRELEAVIGTNVKPHDSHAPASILLRIDAAATGLHYTVLPATTCSQ